MIVAEHLVKTYQHGKVRVLNDLSLVIPDGSFTVILGASGSGKSTLLGLLSGLERPDGGRVVCDDAELSAMSERELTAFRRARVGFVFQQYHLLPHLSAEQNVKLGAHLAQNRSPEKRFGFISGQHHSGMDSGLPSIPGNGKQAMPVGEILQALGLEELRHKRPPALSGGEQQRVCIARALAKRPDYLFCDEPTGALDEATGRAVLDLLAGLQREWRFTMVMVTHNENIARMADTVVRMNSGKIRQVEKNPSPLGAYEIGW